MNIDIEITDLRSQMLQKNNKTLSLYINLKENKNYNKIDKLQIRNTETFDEFFKDAAIVEGDDAKLSNYIFSVNRRTIDQKLKIDKEEKHSLFGKGDYFIDTVKFVIVSNVTAIGYKK